MFTFKTIADLSATTLLEGDVVKVLGEISEGDSLIKEGVVHLGDYVTQNRTVDLVNGLKCVLNPVGSQQGVDASYVLERAPQKWEPTSVTGNKSVPYQRYLYQPKNTDGSFSSPAIEVYSTVAAVMGAEPDGNFVVSNSAEILGLNSRSSTTPPVASDFKKEVNAILDNAKGYMNINAPDGVVNSVDADSDGDLVSITIGGSPYVVTPANRAIAMDYQDSITSAFKLANKYRVPLLLGRNTYEAGADEEEIEYAGYGIQGLGKFESCLKSTKANSNFIVKSESECRGELKNFSLQGLGDTQGQTLLSAKGNFGFFRTNLLGVLMRDAQRAWDIQFSLSLNLNSLWILDVGEGLYFQGPRNAIGTSGWNDTWYNNLITINNFLSVRTKTSAIDFVGSNLTYDTGIIQNSAGKGLVIDGTAGVCRSVNLRNPYFEHNYTSDVDLKGVEAWVSGAIHLAQQTPPVTNRHYNLNDSKLFLTAPLQFIDTPISRIVATNGSEIISMSSEQKSNLDTFDATSRWVSLIDEADKTLGWNKTLTNPTQNQTFQIYDGLRFADQMRTLKITTPEGKICEFSIQSYLTDSWKWFVNSDVPFLNLDTSNKITINLGDSNIYEMTLSSGDGAVTFKFLNDQTGAFKMNVQEV